MTLVAMSIDDEQWDKLLRHELEANGKDVQAIFSEVEKETMQETLEIEFDWGVRDPVNQTTKSKATLHSLHEQLVGIPKGFEKRGMKPDIGAILGV